MADSYVFDLCLPEGGRKLIKSGWL